MTNKTRFQVTPAVFLILQNEQGLILTMQRHNTGHMDGQFGLPAGHVDGGETFAAAMIREAREELGIEIAESDLEFEHIIHKQLEDGVERVDIYFSAQKWTGEIAIMEPQKCSQLKWQYGDELEIIDYIRHVLVQIADGEGLSYWGFEGE
jgi:8-oxo-dGTP diphosphatase